MLFVNILIMLFVAVLVLFALRKRIKASKDNQPVYDDNGILIGYVDKNMMFHEISRMNKNIYNNSYYNKHNERKNGFNDNPASVYGSGIYNPNHPGIDPD